jgi:hypothetical protein
MAIEVQVVVNRFPELVGTFDTTLESAMNAGVAAGIAAADANTRVDTGLLKANKTIEAGPGSRVITWNQDYSLYQDQGTYKMSGTNFSGACVDAAGPVIEAELAGWGG